MVTARSALICALACVLPGAGRADPMSLTGKITDSKGDAVADADVWLVRHLWIRSGDEEDTLLASARSGAEGGFAFPDVDLP